MVLGSAYGHARGKARLGDIVRADMETLAKLGKTFRVRHQEV